jgi:ATP-binding cassette subfamily F protein 3
MGLGEVERSGDIVIEARAVSKAYDRPLFKDVNLTVLRSQCVGVMGRNGSGKTTLIKILIGREKPDSGDVKLGHKVQVGYYDQNLSALPPDTPVVRAVWPEDDPDWVEGDVRDLLARFGLTGDLVFQTVGKLSGGEKGKAALARLAATAANLLVMDEPTNHLDIWSCEALERSIQEFEGTVLVVSHDRYFLNQVADRLIVVADGRVRTIEGDYETYQRLARQEAEVAHTKDGAAGAAAVKSAPVAGKKKRRFPYRKPADLEREIAETETRLGELELALGSPETWRDAARAVATQKEYDTLKEGLASLYAHWEEAIELNT